MRVLGDVEPQTVGRYRLIAELGRGGMGRVLLGAGPDGRLVAVKQVRTPFVEDEGFVARFRREVAVSRKVSGAYTAAVIDADVAGPVPWLASVYVPGPSLQQAVDMAGTLPEQSVLRLAAGLAAALVEIHVAGLVHRDLKPSNVLLAADGPRVIDFGIARAVDGEGTELTHSGWLIGSPGFMSPEQAEGHELTAASDVFSLGSVLVMACSGASPFAGSSTPRTLYNVVHTEPDLGAVPAEVRRIAELCLAKDPAARPTPAELLAVIGGLEPSATPWPAAVHRLIELQQAEVVRLLEQRPAADLIDEPSNEVTVAETTTMPIPAPTVDLKPNAAPAWAKRWRRTLIGVLMVAAVVSFLVVWSPWSPSVPGRPTTSRTPGSELVAFKGHTGAVYGLAFSPDGQMLATASYDGSVRLWNVATGREMGRLSHGGKATDVAFSPDGHLLATAGGGPTVRLWDVTTQQLVGQVPHTEGVSDIVFTPDSSELLTSNGTELWLWWVDTRESHRGPVIFTADEPVVDLTFNADGRLFATAAGSAAQLWNAYSVSQESAPFVGDRGEPVHAVAIGPDGSTMAVGSDDGVTTLWDVGGHQRLGTFRGDSAVQRVAFSKNGRTLATVGDALELWDVAERRPLDRPVTGTIGLAFSPDNRTVATGTKNGTVWLYRLPNN
jgi:eukaryotic-like serine/threonine-protein kinase